VQIEQEFMETCDTIVNLSATVNNASSIDWLDARDSLLASGEDVALPLTGETLFRVRATSATGCVVEDTVTVISHAIHVDLPTHLDLCLGDTLAIQSTNLGFGAVNYRWTPDSLVTSGANTANPVLPDSTGERFYTVFLDNEFGCQDSAEVRVTVIDPDLALTFDADLECDGTSVQLVNTTPVEYSRYQWLLGDSLATQIIGDSIVFNYQIAGEFQVCLTLDYDAPCVDTICQMITTLPSDTELIPQFNFEIVDCQEDSLTIQFLDESISGFDTVNYQWLFGDTTISTEQNPIMTFTESELLGVRLTLAASEECESSIMQAFQIDVLSLELDSIVAACSGNPVVLNPGGNENLIYRWSPAEGLTGPNVASPAAAPSETTTYTVTVTHPLANGCQIMRTTTVDVDGTIELGLPDEISSCGEEITIGVLPIEGVSLRWIDDTGAIVLGDTITVAGDYEGRYLIELADTTGCAGRDTINFINQGINIIKPIGDTITTCEGQTVRVGLSNGNPNDTLVVEWSPLGLITRDSSTISPTFFGFTDTIVPIYYTARNQFGCSLSDSLIFKIRDFEVRLPAEDFAVCPGSPTPLNPDFNENLEYTWSPATGLDDPNSGNPTITISDSMTYNVLVTVGQGVGACRDSFLVGVGIGDATVVTFADESPALCEPAPITLEVSADRPVTFEWSDALDFEMVLDTGTSITVMPDLGADEYYLRVTDMGGGCVSIETITINTFPIEVSLPDVSEVCIGGGTTLMVRNDGLEQNLTYEWMPDEIISEGQGTAMPTIDADEAQTLTATVTNDFGCTATVSTALELIDISTTEGIAINATPDTVVLGGSTQLEVFALQDFEYEWTPTSTLDNAIIANPIATPTETTLYTVEISQGNCVGTRDIEITVLTDVCREPFIFIPAAFTPNGDGRNDVLFVRGLPIESMVFSVYNRWGELVFQTTDQSVGWDGT
ncbi:MAG: gliding motility-associated C-terminal domain-containing protein, partial [Bacteroidota bacterium]